MFNNILQYYYITNYFHGYLMYVIALPIIILKQLFFFTVSAVYKKNKNMINQYIKVNESYRIIIPIISSHFSFSNITKYISIVIVV